MDCKNKEVDFKTYCQTCEYKENEESSDECNECLNNPSNTYSRKPVMYKEK